MNAELKKVQAKILKGVLKPEGQKFPIGTIVRVSNDNPCYKHFSLVSKLAVVVSTYYQEYGGNGAEKKLYCLASETGDLSCWYEEQQLTAVESCIESCDGE